MHSSIVQVGQFHSVKNQPLHNVLVYAPTIIWVKKGHKELLWRDHNLEFYHDDWLVIPANQYLTFTNMAQNNVFFSKTITFLQPPPEDWLNTQQSAIQPKEPRIKVTEPLIYCFNILSEMASKKLSRGAQEQLLLGFYQELRSNNALSLLFPSANTSMSENIARYLSVSPGDEHKVETVAKHFSMSRATLIRKLSMENTSFRQILTEIRMGFALGLLQQQHQLLNVALACGYQSQSRFSSRFKQQFGISPKQYLNTLK
ncbi:MAG: helix-turn-helix transcriptional regulator [Oceanospirillaceae bacterium]|nr:helix-turn-helix transcriptional regulator [Oceanospirillaceae bacterium]